MVHKMKKWYRRGRFCPTWQFADPRGRTSSAFWQKTIDFPLVLRASFCGIGKRNFAGLTQKEKLTRKFWKYCGFSTEVV